MLFIKVYDQFPETSEKLAFLASQIKNMSIYTVDYHLAVIRSSRLLESIFS